MWAGEGEPQRDQWDKAGEREACRKHEGESWSLRSLFFCSEVHSWQTWERLVLEAEAIFLLSQAHSQCSHGQRTKGWIREGGTSMPLTGNVRAGPAASVTPLPPSWPVDSDCVMVRGLSVNALRVGAWTHWAGKGLTNQELSRMAGSPMSPGRVGTAWSSVSALWEGLLLLKDFTAIHRLKLIRR